MKERGKKGETTSKGATSKFASKTQYDKNTPIPIKTYQILCETLD